MILNDKEIRKRVEEEKLIENFYEENLQAASYDISITSLVYRFSNNFKRIILSDDNTFNEIYEEVDIKYGYDLKSEETIFVRLNEKVNMSKDIAGKIFLRNSFIRLGLIINAPFINPTYSGYLNISIHNNSPHVIEITPNLKVGQLVFETITESPSENKLYANKIEAKFQNEKAFTAPNMKREVNKENFENQLSKIINKIKRGE